MTIILVLFLAFISLIFPQKASAQFKISEVYPNPLSGEQEVVEIVNTATHSASLSGWYLKDKLSTSSTIFSFPDFTLESDYLFLASISGKLNNSGDGVSLFDPDGNLVDEMSYSSSSQSLSWSLDVSDNLFKETKPSLGQKNQFESNAVPSTTPPTELESFDHLEISEVMSCPENGNEWFKIRNSSSQSRILNDFFVVDQNNNQFTFSTEIDADSFQIIYLNQSILNNSGDSLSLYNSNKNLVQSITFGECEVKGLAFINENDKWLQPTNNFSVEESESDMNSDSKVNLSTNEEDSDHSGNDLVSDSNLVISSPNFGSDYVTTISFADESHSLPKITNFIANQNSSQLKKWPYISVILGGILISSGSLVYFYSYDYKENKSIC